MRIEDRFTVGVPVEEAWKVLLDLERVAPCMPGAQLQEIDGDEHRGVVKVKLGAITAQFKGVVRFTEVDEAQHRVVLRAEGREIRGQGNAAATVTANLADADGGGTEVAIDTDLTITGRMAQFGRGVMADVSSKLLGQFARCLEEDLAGTSDTAAPNAATDLETDSPWESDVAAQPQPSEPPAAAAVEEPKTEPAAPPQRRVVQSAPAEPVDLFAVVGPSVTKQALPAALVAVLLLLAVTKHTARRWVLSLAGAGLVAATVAAERRR